MLIHLSARVGLSSFSERVYDVRYYDRPFFNKKNELKKILKEWESLCKDKLTTDEMYECFEKLIKDKYPEYSVINAFWLCEMYYIASNN